MNTLSSKDTRVFSVLFHFVSFRVFRGCGIIFLLAPRYEGGLVKPFDTIVTLEKMDPKSEGIDTPRKKKPKEIAVITENCTGCAGSPACVPYCPVQDCMFWVPDEDHPPFGHIEVDPFLCIGCKKCLSKGPDGAFLDGCPWDAIEMMPTEEIEAVVGKMAV